MSQSSSNSDSSPKQTPKSPPMRVSVKIRHPIAGKAEMYTSHTDLNQLLEELNEFVKESQEAIEAGERLSITCCNGISSSCLKFRTKAKIDTKVKTDLETKDVNVRLS